MDDFEGLGPEPNAQPANAAVMDKPDTSNEFDGLGPETSTTSAIPAPPQPYKVPNLTGIDPNASQAVQWIQASPIGSAARLVGGAGKVLGYGANLIGKGYNALVGTPTAGTYNVRVIQ